MIEQWLGFSTMGAPQKTKLTPATEVEIAPPPDDEIQEVDTTAEGEKKEAIFPQATQATASQPPCILLVDDSRLIHASVGKVSFDADKISENTDELLQTIIKLKPSSSKGVYVKSVTLSSTMGVGVSIESNSLV